MTRLTSLTMTTVGHHVDHQSQEEENYEQQRSEAGVLTKEELLKSTQKEKRMFVSRRPFGLSRMGSLILTTAAFLDQNTMPLRATRHAETHVISMCREQAA